ncbi:MAG: hypothetical protein ABIO79_07840 [Ferruginibacter sp.]
MIKFPRQLASEFFEYTYAGSFTDFSNKLENLTAKPDGFSEYPNLSVKLTPGNEFTVINRYILETFKSHPFDTSTTLKGYYFKNNLNTTTVNLLVTPHFIIPILFLLLPIFFMVILFKEIPDKQNFPGACLLIVLCMVATSAGLLFLSALCKKRLLNRFVQYMELTKIA